MIDSHCHLDHEPLFENIPEVLKRCKENAPIKTPNKNVMKESIIFSPRLKHQTPLSR